MTPRYFSVIKAFLISRFQVYYKELRVLAIEESGKPTEYYIDIRNYINHGTWIEPSKTGICMTARDFENLLPSMKNAIESKLRLRSYANKNRKAGVYYETGTWKHNLCVKTVTGGITEEESITLLFHEVQELIKKSSKVLNLCSFNNADKMESSFKTK